ncbi:ricin-type beta-trefoil lectin domain protein [Streptomyces sp. NPDC002328]|uniref:ricin-type beta-trefoil lectin domain protein n=1 Tax=Streptomyces sp. NPDC002328 TaxID=3364642 RepID=UPI0036A7B848
MKDAGLSNSPSARRLEVTDEQLSAELKNWSGASPALHPVGELLDRHWEAAISYARLCADSERAAGMLTTAAFTRLFGETLRQNGPTAAWRPYLLVTVRRIAAEWDSDGRRDLLHPELRAAEGDADQLAARLLPPPNRRLISRAFQRLPQTARCLLWHAEAEVEALASPAALLGMEEEGARIELRRSRERLREECLQVHRELAVEEECHRYDRLLDVTCRRGGDVDPDLRAHLDQCRHCAHTADQLRQFEADLGAALAEGVLGWAAGEYRELRAGRVDAPVAEPERPRPRMIVGEAFTDDSYPAHPGHPARPAHPVPSAEPAEPAAHPGAAAFAGTTAASAADAGLGGTFPPFPTAFTAAPDPAAGPRTPGAELVPVNPRPHSRRSAQKAARRARRRNLAIAVLTVSGLVVLPLVLWSALGSDGDGSAAGDEAAGTAAPDTDAADVDPSWAGAAEENQGTLRGRLHNVSSGLCIGITGGKAVQGAEAQLAVCSSAADQQWTYETDGLLRSTAGPDLCLDSQLGFSVRLSPCAAASAPEAKNVRYDFTLQGTLIPRGNQNLALAPAATDGSGALVLKNRADGGAQRWVIDTSQPDPQMQIVNWDADSTLIDTSGAPVTPKAAKSPAPSPANPSASAPKPSATPAPKSTETGSSSGSASGSDDDSCSPYAWYSCSGNGQQGWNGGNGPGGYGYGNGYGYGGYGNGYGYGYGGYGNGYGGGR